MIGIRGLCDTSSSPPDEASPLKRAHVSVQPHSVDELAHVTTTVFGMEIEVTV